MSLIEDMRRLVAVHDETAEDAYNLWSWLPSNYFAQATHGDYADEHRPTVACIMEEASRVMAYASGHDLNLDNPATRSKFGCGCEDCQLNKCPSKKDILEVLSKFRRKVP